MKPPTVLLIYVVLMTIIRKSSALILPVVTRNVIAECLHLTVKEEGQHNFFKGNHGGRCCMCRIGTRVAKECMLGAPNSTICEDCQYDEEKQSYVDFGPHMEKECHEDKLECYKNQNKIPGSPSLRAKCVCADGSEPVDHGFRCNPVADGGLVAPGTNAITTGGKELPTETPANPTEKGTTGIMKTKSEEVSEPTYEVTAKDKGSKASISKPTPMSAQQGTVTHANGTLTTHNTPTVDFVISRVSVTISGIVLIAFFIWCFRGRIQRPFHSWREHCGVCCFTGEVNVQVHGECGENLKDGSKEKPAYFEPCVAFYQTEEYTLLNSADPIDEVSEVQREFPAQPGDGLDQPDVQVMDDGDQPSAVEDNYRVLQEKLRYDAVMEMAKEIDEKDLPDVGRKLIRGDMEFRDIYDSKTVTIRAEKARRIFLRAIQLRPDLTLADLRKAVQDLGYLREIVDKIALGGAVD